jgi:hypothetical protein
MILESKLMSFDSKIEYFHILSGLGMPTLKLYLAFEVYKRKNKLILLAVTPSGAW